MIVSTGLRRNVRVFQVVPLFEHSLSVFDRDNGRVEEWDWFIDGFSLCFDILKIEYMQMATRHEENVEISEGFLFDKSQSSAFRCERLVEGEEVFREGSIVSELLWSDAVCFQKWRCWVPPVSRRLMRYSRCLSISQERPWDIAGLG